MPEDYGKMAKALTDAKKTLGKDGDVPKDKGNIKKDIDAYNGASDSCKAAKNDLLAALLAWKKSVGAIEDDVQAYQDLVDGSDFGLDAKNADDKKKIDDAQKVFDDGLKDYQDLSKKIRDITESSIKSLSSLDKLWDTL